MSKERRREEFVVPPFATVAIIGRGQVGKMLQRQFEKDDRFGLFVAGRSEIRDVMTHTPEVIALATPNPVGEAIENIAKTAAKPFTLILPQNGVGVVEQARAVVDKDSVPTIIRASLFTPVNQKEDDIFYNPKKLRVAIAPENRSEREELSRTKLLFEAAGFEVVTVEDYKSMEWTKLLTNCLGSTSTITGLPPAETFTDADLFALEVQGLKDRLRIMEAQGLNLAEIPWIKPLRFVKHIPTGLPYLPRWVIAGFMAAGRDNMPSAAGRKINAGGYPTEVLEYHRPFIMVGEGCGLKSPVDEALLTIIERHNGREIDLQQMSKMERKKLLLKSVG